MNISEVVDFLNFWINKKTNSYLTIDECVSILDRSQIALYSDYKSKYATSQEIKDALSPFRATYDFTPTNTISGYIVIPSNSNYLDLLDIQITFQISNRTMYFPVELVNEDERANRLNSQIDPVTSTSPIGEQTAPRYFRLYPQSIGYTGTVTYFRRPVKPVYSYTIISGRVPVYLPDSSVQLEWRESEIDEIVIKALQIAGINLSDEEISQFAVLKSTNNYQNQNRV